MRRWILPTANDVAEAAGAGSRCAPETTASTPRRGPRTHQHTGGTAVLRTMSQGSACVRRPGDARPRPRKKARKEFGQVRRFRSLPTSRVGGDSPDGRGNLTDRGSPRPEFARLRNHGAQRDSKSEARPSHRRGLDRPDHHQIVPMDLRADWYHRTRIQCAGGTSSQGGRRVVDPSGAKACRATLGDASRMPVRRAGTEGLVSRRVRGETRIRHVGAVV